MAKVTVTFQDNEDGGAVDVRVVFDPPVQREDEGTLAQQMAVVTVMGINDTFGEDTAITFAK
ncbi:hypothetical protein [Desulfovibrio aminophilus]|uniref:hypothetical protein n=1 Tax=Desulfovibrio aminophilus TaxID=81425 RepID=UPI000415D3B0|nr:hypothetical protein [Desulfovibrio aminophilus]